jgi:glutamyl-tRNA reductase
MAIERTTLFGDALDTAPSRSEPQKPLEPLDLTAFGLSLSETPLPVLEEYVGAFSNDVVRSLFSRTPGIRELCILRTCQRVELFVLVAPGATEEVSVVLGDVEWRAWRGIEAVRHLYRVVCGLESVAIGEQEVRAQLSDSAGRVLSRHPRPVLKRLLRQACADAETLSSSVKNCSVAALGVSKLLEEIGQPFPRVLIVGSGAVGRQVAELLAPSARVTLLYRRKPPTQDFLRATGARCAPIECLGAELQLSDAVITAAKSGGRLIGWDQIGSRAHPLLIIDLGVPRNVDPSIRRFTNVRLWDISELGRPNGYHELLTELTPRVDRRAIEIWAELSAELWEPAVAEIWRAAETLRRKELALGQGFLKSLTCEQRRAVDVLTKRLVRKLFREPTSRFRQLAKEESELPYRLLELLTPGSDRP